MAYPIFSQPQGPDVHVSLYGDSYSQGINAGNAQKTTTQSIIEGLTSGIKTGLGIATQIQQIGLNSQQADINDERIQAMQRENAIAEANAITEKNTAEATAITKTNAAQQAAITSTQALEDTQNAAVIGNLLTNGTPEQKQAILTDPKYSGTLLRDSKLAQQTLGNLSNTPGIDQEIVKQARNTYDAIEIAKQRDQFARDQEKAQLQAAEETRKAFVPAFNYLQSSSPGFAEAVRDSNTKPSNIRLYKRSELQFSEDGNVITNAAGQPQINPNPVATTQGYVLLNGRKIIDSNISESQGKDFGDNLEKFKKYSSAAYPRLSATQTETQADAKTEASNSPVENPGLLGQESTNTGTADVPANTNAAATERAKARHAKNRALANATNVSDFGKLEGVGANIARARAVATQTSYVTTKQTAPQAPGAAALTETAPPVTTAAPTRPAIVVNTPAGPVVSAPPPVVPPRGDSATPVPPAATSAPGLAVTPIPTVASTPTSTPSAVATTPPPTPAATENTPPQALRGKGKSVPTVTPLVQGLSQLSSVLGGAPVTATVTPTPTFRLSPGDVERISSIPGLEDKSALLKGLVTVESRGKANAVSPAGAAGLTQLMVGAAKDVGLAPADRFNPRKNIEGGEDYLQKQYDQIQPALIRAFEKQRQYERHTKDVTTGLANQGIPRVPDPRFVLASFNGGAKYILDGIAKGNTTWPQMVEYLDSVKTDKAFKENVNYANNVITASLSYLKGGNASDDAYVQTLLNFGIVDIVGA